jgi:hypothetical protein
MKCLSFEFQCSTSAGATILIVCNLKKLINSYEWFRCMPFFTSCYARSVELYFHRTVLCYTVLFVLGTFAPNAMGASVSPVVDADIRGSSYRLENDILSATVELRDGHLIISEIKARERGDELHPEESFVIELQNGREVASSQLSLVTQPHLEILAPRREASKKAETIPGKSFCADLAFPHPETASVHWCLEMRDGTNYVRQQITIKAGENPLPITEIKLFSFKDSGAEAHVAGSVVGSPIVDGNFFFGFEHPLAVSQVADGKVTASLKRVLSLPAGSSVTYSSVIGDATPGLMRRSFLEYLENERAHAYRPFLHYNSWYDLGSGERYGEAAALDRINAFGEELVRKRGVTMDSFLFDDGWDNDGSLWDFDSGFPDGFTNVSNAARKYGFGIGVWMSPWGGYLKEKEHRIAYGRAQGYEIVKGGFALSGPRYYKRFEQTCLEMMTKYHVNMFKFDGTGNANQVFPGSAFDSDFSAAINLIQRLRKQDPNIFINLTSGTYPSPFWLLYADSVWRGGEDHGFAGVGTARQQWITYRDGQTYKDVVRGGPLFPLSSLMLHGMIYAREGDIFTKGPDSLGSDPGHDFPAEVHSFFGSGTNLQEMYITPSLLSSHDWDVLAESARWSRENASTLKDTHWVGGDPYQLQVYGWASYSPAKGILTLRNPSAAPQQFTGDIRQLLQLPPGAPISYELRSPWKDDAAAPVVRLRAGVAHTFLLQPFQVVTLEAQPRRTLVDVCSPGCPPKR